MSFLYPSIALLGLVLVLLPLVVHLISRRRRQRVEWAAMDFLLDSNKKNHNRSKLEEWLLLLLRILAIVLAGIIAAVPQLPERLSDWFEGAPATHIVVLDDSYSMTEQTESGSPWRLAKDAVERLVTRSERIDSPVKLFLYSDEVTGRDPSFLNEPLSSSSGYDEQSIRSSKLAIGPTAALKRIQQFIEQEELDESRCYLTLLSDFQRNSHANGDAFVSALESIAETVDGIVLSPCSNATDSTVNLTLSELSIEPGPRAIGVEATGKILVTSHNQTSVAKTTVEVFREQSLLTSLEIGPFDPNETLEVTFPLLVQSAGPQVIQATLPSDSLEGDNERYMVLDLPLVREVLLIDGSKQGSEGVAFAAALAPQSSIQTGWQPRLLTATRIESLGDLSTTALVCLLDMPRLGQQAKRELSAYVQQGGGLLNVLGPHVDRSIYNNLIAKDSDSSTELPLLPVQLDLPTQAPWVEPGEAMIQVNDHPALRILSGQRNGFLPLVRIGMFHASKPLVQPHPKSLSQLDVQVLIKLVSGDPLLMEHRFGKGRIVTLLTTATPQQKSLAWSNLATLPIFPVMVNELGGWLAQYKTAPIDTTLGEQPPRKSGIKTWKLARHTNSDRWENLRDETDVNVRSLLESGAYRIISTSTVGVSNQRPSYLAANVDPLEGDLAKLSNNELSRSFDRVAEIVPAESLFLDSDNESSWRPMHLAAMILLALLIFERLLATRCSNISAVPTRVGGNA